MQTDFVLGLRFFIDAHDDFSVRGELDGVADQVHDDLPQTAGIAHDAVRDIGSDVTDQLETLGMGADGQRRHGVVQMVAQMALDQF